MQSMNSSSIKPQRLTLAALVLFCGVLAGCSTPREIAESGDVYDPYEETNRDMFEFNLTADRNVLKPVASAYRDNVPEGIRHTLRNMLDHYSTPVILFNDLLQWDWARATDTAYRMVANTIEGMGGMVDVANKRGVHPHSADFGQTLAIWGVGEGPYLMLPLLGPSNPRDLVGRVGDMAMNPLGMFGPADIPNAASFSTSAVDITDARSENLNILDELERGSLDFYATIRSLHSQHRRDEIRKGIPSTTDPGTSFFSLVTPVPKGPISISDTKPAEPAFPGTETSVPAPPAPAPAPAEEKQEKPQPPLKPVSLLTN